MGMKILVAEDSPSVALVYKKTLEKRGHMVIITENGNILTANNNNATEAAQAIPTATNTPQLAHQAEVAQTTIANNSAAKRNSSIIHIHEITTG